MHSLTNVEKVLFKRFTRFNQNLYDFTAPSNAILGEKSTRRNSFMFVRNIFSLSFRESVFTPKQHEPITSIVRPLNIL